MVRRPTLSELVWPDDPEDASLPVEWAESVAVQALNWLWQAFESMKEKHLSSINLDQPLEQLERNLTFLHYGEILEIWARETAGFSSMRPGHEIPEFETRSPAPAKPPAYDLGFVLTENQRWIWPVEAKVVSTPNGLAAYLSDVREKFIDGIAAPLVGEAAMVGYLLSGSSGVTLANIGTELKQMLLDVPGFNRERHRSSEHDRANAPYLRLHHLIMEILQSVSN